jgi:hypothetical protein
MPSLEPRAQASFPIGSWASWARLGLALDMAGHGLGTAWARWARQPGHGLDTTCHVQAKNHPSAPAVIVRTFNFREKENGKCSLI